MKYLCFLKENCRKYSNLGVILYMLGSQKKIVILKKKNFNTIMLKDQFVIHL